MGNDRVILRCDGVDHPLVLSNRDIHLLDGGFFAPLSTRIARSMFGLDFIRGLGAPPLNEVLVTHRRLVLLRDVQGLLSGFEDHRDLLSYSYRFTFGGHPESSGAGSVSGFRVRGLFGSISARPSGYCDLTLSETAPTGRGRMVEILDMRTKRELETDNWGLLKIYRKTAEVGWFAQLPPAIEWLRERSGSDVEVLHR